MTYDIDPGCALTLSDKNNATNAFPVPVPVIRSSKMPARWHLYG